MPYVSKTTSDGRFVRVKDYKKRARKNRLKRRFLFFTFLFFCFMLFLHLAPFFKIKEIRCREGSHVSKEEIISVSTISYDYNIFRTSLKKAKRNIDGIPYVKKTVIKRKFPNIIQISITECEAFANVPLGEGYIYIDDQCKMLEYANAADAQLPYIQQTGVIAFEAGKILQSDNPNKTEALISLFKALRENDLAAKVKEINIPSNEELAFIYNDLLEIFVGGIDNLGYKIAFTSRTISEELGEKPKGFLDISNPKYGLIYREKK